MGALDKVKGLASKIKVPALPKIAIKIPLPPFIAKIWEPIWNPPSSRLFARTVVTTFFVTVLIALGATFQFVKFLKTQKAHHALNGEQASNSHNSNHQPEEHGSDAQNEEGEEEEHSDAHAAHNGGHEAGGGEHAAEEGGGGHGGPSLGMAEFPEKVLKSQDGIEEEGKDLVDPKASLLDELMKVKAKDLEVKREHYFVTLPEVFSNAREGQSFDGNVMAKVTLEVDSAKAAQESEERKAEIHSIVASLISERQRRRLASVEGMVDLKIAIQQNVNHVLKGGKVIDVLFTDFSVR